jgi:hypothetical protein
MIDISDTYLKTPPTEGRHAVAGWILCQNQVKSRQNQDCQDYQDIQDKKYYEIIET